MFAKSVAKPAFAGCLVVAVALVAAPCAQARSAADDALEAAREFPLLTSPESAPQNLFAAPPPAGSKRAASELQQLRDIHSAFSAKRIARADRDGGNEQPGAFSEAAGRDLSHLPATMSLLLRIQGETDRIVENGKSYFKRLRPYTIDPSLPHCGKGGNRDDSYPSGHSGFAWSVGWALSRLLPERAPQILDRAQDYAFGREVCGVHYPSDVEASHAAAVLIADRMLADPKLADQVAAARRELASSVATASVTTQ